MQISYKLEAYEGPLDLLLQLIQKNKLNIYDIPIVELLQQYMETIQAWQQADLDIATEFLEMAARLVQIKAAMLLPQHEEEADEMRETLDTVLQLLMSEAEAVGSLKSNSDTSLKLSEESAFQILQLLNIAMDRKVPTVTPEARKLWYDNSVAKLKKVAGVTDKSGGDING